MKKFSKIDFQKYLKELQEPQLKKQNQVIIMERYQRSMSFNELDGSLILNREG